MRAHSLKINKLLIYFTLIIFLLTLPNLARSSEMYEYVNTTGDSKVLLKFQIDYQDDGIVYRFLRPDETYITHCDSSGAVQRWYYKDIIRNSEYQGVREENSIHLSGILQGKHFEKHESVDAAPWFEIICLSLFPFVNSNDRTITYWVFRPQDLKLIKMKATKEGAEILMINGSAVETHKVRLNLTGFLSMFWHGYYWFRASDGLFLRYEGASGPPGTPITVIEPLFKVENHVSK